ncbi:MAG TPA: hypothetical protein VNW92_22450 [Polyangiaceae bacterium]|nr:hypothetical protein [Polyangiaceae bacterium]
MSPGMALLVQANVPPPLAVDPPLDAPAPDPDPDPALPPDPALSAGFEGFAEPQPSTSICAAKMKWCDLPARNCPIKRIMGFGH